MKLIRVSNKEHKYIISKEPIEEIPTEELENELAWLYYDNQIIEQENYGIDWGYDLEELDKTRDAMKKELQRRKSLKE